jgi:hypothetical protein
MSPLDEELIVTYAQRPEELSLADRSLAEQLISGDEAAARIFAFYSGMFDEVRHRRSEVLPGVEKLLRKLSPVPPRIPLHPAGAPLDRPLPPPSAAEIQDAAGLEDAGEAIIFVSDIGNIGIRIYHADPHAHADAGPAAGPDANPQVAYRIFASDGTGEGSLRVHALLNLPAVDTQIKLDSSGRAMLMGHGTEASEVFRNVELYPAQHYETISSQLLLDGARDLFPGFKLRIHSPEGDRWLPVLHTDLTDIHFITLEWTAPPSAEWSEDQSVTHQQDAAGQLDAAGQRDEAWQQDVTHQRVIEKTGTEAVVSIEALPPQLLVALFG